VKWIVVAQRAVHWLTIANLIVNLGGFHNGRLEGRMIKDCSTHVVSLLFRNAAVIIVTVCHN